MPSNVGSVKRITRIGVTGGIGSGKSVVCKKFVGFGIETFSADDIGREVTNSNPSLRDQIIHHFGIRSYDPTNNLLNTKYIADIVFKEKKKLKILNSLVHPFVLMELQKRFNALLTSAQKPYCIVEAALMYESDLYRAMDYVLFVSADEKIRIKRTLERDKIREQEIKGRIANQLPAEEIMRMADFVLRNEGTINQLEEKVHFFHDLFQTLRPKDSIPS